MGSLRAWQQLFQAVKTTSDGSIAVLQGHFEHPPVANRLEDLGPMLIDWKRNVERLEAAICSPYAQLRRISLGKMVTKQRKAVDALSALEAVHLRGEVPVEDMLLALRKVADSAHSVAEQTRALGMFTAGARAEENPKAKRGRCKFHDQGRCTYGAEKCRWNHVGEAGSRPAASGSELCFQSCPRQVALRTREERTPRKGGLIVYVCLIENRCYR